MLCEIVVSHVRSTQENTACDWLLFPILANFEWQGTQLKDQAFVCNAKCLMKMFELSRTWENYLLKCNVERWLNMKHVLTM